MAANVTDRLWSLEELVDRTSKQIGGIMLAWEYLVEPITFGDVGGLDLGLESLNAMGRNGWELVTVVPNALGIDAKVAIYKRPSNQSQNSN
jgi:hypothetical protein